MRKLIVKARYRNKKKGTDFTFEVRRESSAKRDDQSKESRLGLVIDKLSWVFKLFYFILSGNIE